MSIEKYENLSETSSTHAYRSRKPVFEKLLQGINRAFGVYYVVLTSMRLVKIFPSPVATRPAERRACVEILFRSSDRTVG